MRYGLMQREEFMQLTWSLCAGGVALGRFGALGLLQSLVWHHEHDNGSPLPPEIGVHKDAFAPFATLKGEWFEPCTLELTELSKFWLLGKRKAKPVQVKKNDGYSPGFRAFYEVYPVKKAPHDAWKAWVQMESFRPNDDQICAAVNRQLQGQEWKRDNGKWIPYPASWLRAGRWADEVVIDKPSQQKKYDGDEIL